MTNDSISVSKPEAVVHAMKVSYSILNIRSVLNDLK